MQWDKLGWLERRRVASQLHGIQGPLPPAFRTPPPRELTLYSRQGAALDDPLIHLGVATRGVVERSTVTPDRGGPDHDVRILFMAGRTPARLRWKGGYDSLDQAMGSPEHHAWFKDHMARPGAELTVLVDGAQARIVGMLDGFERLDLYTILARAQDCSAERRIEWLSLGIDLVRSAIDQDPTAFAERAHTMAEVWTDNREPRRWAAELATRLRKGETVMPQLAVLSPALPDAWVAVWVEE